jgi:hypothetical protein
VLFTSQTLRHKIRERVFGRAIFDVDRPFFDMVPDEVELSVDVLRLGAMCAVFRE